MYQSACAAITKYYRLKRSSIFSDHNGVRLEINYKKKTAKTMSMWRLNNMLLNNQWVTKEFTEEIKKIPGDK